jgi:hypothetical protein
MESNIISTSLADGGLEHRIMNREKPCAEEVDFTRYAVLSATA